MTNDDTRMLRGLIEQILLDIKKRREAMECQNNPVPHFPLATYSVYESDLIGWTVETLAEALKEPMAAIGVEVQACPRVSGPASLVIHADMPPAEEDLFRETVRALVDQVVVEGRV